MAVRIQSRSTFIKLSKIKSEYTYQFQGSNKYANEQFESNVNGLRYSNCKPTWINDRQLDDGYLQILNPTQSRAAAVQFGIGAVDSTKTYILKFSSRSIKNDSYIKVNMIMNGSPWTQTKPTFTYLDTARTETQLLISPTYNNANVSVMFKLDNADESVWIDNLQFYEVDTTMINVDEYIRFEYNETSSPKTFTVIDPMMDVTGTKYSGSITLQPYSSVVLMKDLTTLKDVSLPKVSDFSMPSTSTSLTITISSFTAIDNIGVTGYLLTETSTTPIAGSSGWSSSKPTTYIFSSIGTKTLYAWAKDAAGNVSASLSASVTISYPIASTFTFTGPSSGNVNSASAHFTVTPNNLYTGTITLTPSGTGSAGISAKVITFSNSSSAQTFSITPTIAGNITLTPSNSGSITNPGILTYNAIGVVPDAPISPVATAGNASCNSHFCSPCK